MYKISGIMQIDWYEFCIYKIVEMAYLLALQDFG